MGAGSGASGHVFLSYVREDAKRVDRLQEILEGAGVSVWRDTEDLWPGQNWKARIRQAITTDSLVFLACFSARSLARGKTYQNEELTLAIDELRQRRPDEPWLVPVRLDECEIPDREIGGGQWFSALQRVDLFGPKESRNVARLVSTVLTLLGGTDRPAQDLPLSLDLTEQLKAMLPLPERDIALEDLVMGVVDDCTAALNNPERFPTASPDLANGPARSRFLAQQATRYLETVRPPTELLVTGCALGSPRHDAVWKRAIEAVGGTVASQPTGLTALVDLRHLGLLPVALGAALGAFSRENWPALLAVAAHARVRGASGVEKTSVLSFLHPWLPFGNAELAATVWAWETADELTDDKVAALHEGRIGKRYTPVSDALHDWLRPLLKSLIRADEDYNDAFDELEVLLAILAEGSAIDARTRGKYEHGAWFGRFTWSRRFDPHFEERVWEAHRDALLAAGAFGGDPTAGAIASSDFLQQAAEARHRR